MRPSTKISCPKEDFLSATEAKDDIFVTAHNTFVMAHDIFVMAHNIFVLAHNIFVMARSHRIRTVLEDLVAVQNYATRQKPHMTNTLYLQRHGL